MKPCRVGVSKHQNNQSKRQCNRNLTLINGYRMHNGGHADNKKTVKDTAAEDCSQANLVLLAELCNDLGRKLGCGRAYGYNSGSDNEFIYTECHGNGPCPGND